VRRHKGSLIYAGGDDVLAFVPLHTALKCARELASEFNQKFNEDFPIEEDGKINYPTLSAGIAVTHHLEPLQDALTLARAAEKKAKGIPGKSALAVIVDKRSGASRFIADTWASIDRRLQTFIGWHCSDQIPDKAGYELRDLALRLEGSKIETEGDRDYLDRAKLAEATRILHRKRGEHGREDLRDQVLVEFEGMLHSADSGDERHIVDQLANELIIAKVFADAVSQAGNGVLSA
jgi:CRISPR-associated protein Cmr2